jgi:hypothetical protein
MPHVTEVAAPWQTMLPHSWLDVALCVLLLAGARQGVRRGTRPALVALVALLVALMVATRLAVPLSTALDARWHLDRQLAGLVPSSLPDGSGAVPYTPAAFELLLRGLQQGGPRLASYGQVLGALAASAGPPPAPGTLDRYVAWLVGGRLVVYLCFAGLFALMAACLGALGSAAGRRPRGRRAGIADVALGGICGAAARWVELGTALTLARAANLVPAIALVHAFPPASGAAALALVTLHRLLDLAGGHLGAWLVAQPA